MTKPHTDIASNDWVDRFLPEGVRPYARLMRLDRPIGTWLLLLPCWWSLALASKGFPPIEYFLLFAIGALVMRGAGCAINDFYDRELDRRVERTATRPLASGQLGSGPAMLFVILLFLTGLLVLAQFNVATILIGVLSVPVIFIYPLAKRFTNWPQLILGLAFNWGALLGWTVIHQDLQQPAILLYIAGIFWTLGYDTIYAHQDKRDDALVGVKSLALYLGAKSRFWISGFYFAFLSLVVFAASGAGVGFSFYLLFPAAIAHAVWQIVSWNPDDPLNCLKRFRSNRDLGLLVFLALLAGRLWS